MKFLSRWAVTGFGLALVTVAGAQTVSYTANVDVSKDRKPISPLVYGVNFANTQQARDLNLRINRSGGNATTRYNWQQNATSSGSDWYFLSHAEPGALPSEAVDSWVLSNLASGVQGGTASMITIPIIGWVAKIHPNRNHMWSFSVIKYGAQQATEPWNPDAGNGRRPNGTPVTGNDPNDANIPVAISYQQNWLMHLVNRFGRADQGGVKYYVLDNEPALWHETHRDVMPTGVRADDLFVKQRDAAALIKSVDPTALVCGPEEWGWLGYLYSGYDFQWLADHGWSGNPPDRQLIGGMDIAPWLLKKFKEASAAAGKRLLDVFTLHYYPQGNYGWEDVSNAAVDWRARSTRSLWDPNYTDESWIGQKIRLLPRMKEWVAAQFPDTKLGVTEYNWGADTHISGALAQAEAMAIFGREGVELANRWVCPPSDSVTFKAIQMFRNVDGANLGFGNTSVSCAIPNQDFFSAFASQDGSSGPVKIMLLNKSRTQTINASVKFLGRSTGKLRIKKAYRLTSTNVIQPVSTHSLPRGGFPISLPKQSITLVILE
ncbi:MAG TPA: glycoside hydrolase family 44 protein [Fimbriimonadaceae bacterium]|nr:glycoside hydrolase family 44 protein [Fimbriimonadaceae bacterium]